MKSAIVTGSAGAIASHLVSRLQQLNCRVFGVGLGTPRVSHDYLEARVTEDALSRCPFVPDVIFHCAGGSSVAASVQDPGHDFDLSVGSTKEVLNFMSSLKVRPALVFTSSAAVYGNSESEFIGETAPLNPISPYGKHKVICESIISDASKTLGLKVGIARLFSVYGTELRKQLLWDALHKFGQQDYQFFGTGKECRDWLFMDDAIDILLLLAREATIGGLVVNAGFGEAIANARLLSELRRAYDGSSDVRFTGISRSGDPERLVASIEAARSLGWRPRVDLASGLRFVVNWFKTIK